MRINLCHPHLFCCSQHRGALHYMLMSPCRGWVKTVSSRELQTKKPELGLPQYCQCLMLWSSLGRMEVSVLCPNIVEFCDQNNAFNETVLWKIIFNSLPVVQEQHVFFFFFLPQKAYQSTLCWRNKFLIPNHKHGSQTFTNCLLYAFDEMLHELALNTRATPRRW